MPTVIEYIWIDGKLNLRSKTRVLGFECRSVKDVPIWNYDGSSSYQANSIDSEIILLPCAMFRNPFPDCDGETHKFVLCETTTSTNFPTESNKRHIANKLFNRKVDEEPWFGLEQEYFLISPTTNTPLGFPSCGEPTRLQGPYYCGVGAENAFGRKIAEEHMYACIRAGIKISGMNAEVAPGQWEFQVGPCIGISAGDELWMARYILLRIAETHNVIVSFEPRPITGDWNGSGCHTNYSTKTMRDVTDSVGIDAINTAILKLEKKHTEHMEVYGENNRDRMSGKHETASYDTFSHGIGDRTCSVRIGNDTYDKKGGYFEDRRPASNCDPYIVTGKIFETTCLLP